MKNLDLNLLRVFDAVMRERNVLRAGDAISLSPSAVSHALSRLRALLKDELFVRTAAGMVPTVRALEMAPLVRDALVTIERAFGPEQFHPASTDRQFCIAATDYITAVVLPHVLRAVSEQAPNASVTILPASRLDLTTQIDVGRVDVALGSFFSVPHRLREQVLFHARDVLVVAPGHALAGREISLEDLGRLPLLVVSTGNTDDGLLSERGLSRRAEMFDRATLNAALNAIGKSPDIKLVQPHFLAIPTLLAGTEMAAIVPATLAAMFRQAGTAHVSELPWPPAPRPAHMVWHERHSHDPGHAWLRDLLAKAALKAAQMDV
ncbi:LysR family transcriptional regulator [Pseudomonas sp. KK4]|uniref:LysR family transcriptional regulator n=1 Tax=Pseudomonas sp. KK4 TaxID=1855729 RepID=UPI00097CC061|nr:LysR family transcriptional regulator [Pseudomonas sp. KK4]